MDAAQALGASKAVFSATPIGLLRLTRQGLELAQVMPGIDVRADMPRK